MRGRCVRVVKRVRHVALAILRTGVVVLDRDVQRDAHSVLRDERRCGRIGKVRYHHLRLDDVASRLRGEAVVRTPVLVQRDAALVVQLRTVAEHVDLVVWFVFPVVRRMFE